ncbi:hypothetical protein EYC80_004977 [Monilinia laxa]|uniref:Uncharacterized protein n=1 Tax=Monilinia laxa TaxID=61186 RepID=A0A5N6KIH6_MONLA|nr:hypothetical protein EYC80_004977 [Monilinia laxa]
MKKVALSSDREHSKYCTKREKLYKSYTDRALTGPTNIYKQLLQILYIKLCRYLWESPIPFTDPKKTP